MAAEEVIQIGGALFAKNATPGDLKDFVTSTYEPRTRYRTDKKTGKKVPISSKGFQEWVQAGRTAREGKLSFSKRQLPMEVEMRKMQIERLPKGNPHRLNALRSLQKIYTLNPVGETFPTEYAEEINQAKPQISWSKRLTKEKAARLLRDGKIFTSPELVRQIMGDRPEHVNTVMRFLQKQRKGC